MKKTNFITRILMICAAQATFVVGVAGVFTPISVYALPTTPPATTTPATPSTTTPATVPSSTTGSPILTSNPIDANKPICGKGDKEVQVSFDFGCRGRSYGPASLNPILDIAFAIFRFLSAGVGLVVIGSIIVAGIQYSTAQGNPQSTQAAIKRISNSIIGLILYMFIFTIVNFLVPGGIFT